MNTSRTSAPPSTSTPPTSTTPPPQSGSRRCEPAPYEPGGEVRDGDRDASGDLLLLPAASPAGSTPQPAKDCELLG